MDMPRNSFKRAITAGRRQIGLWCNIPDSLSVELLAGAGFDWILIDTEHAPNELPTVVRHLQAAKGGTAHPVVRPAWNDSVVIKRYLDAGAQTLLIPMVQNAEEARRAVAATRYPPDGVRGFASQSRASDFGRVPGYFREAANEICVLVQLETQVALANLEEIAAVPGVDGLFIGPGDLSADMGHVGEPGHPDVVAKVLDAIARVTAAGKPAGILIGNEALAHRFIEAGTVFTAVGSDTTLLTKGAARLVADFSA
jgi:4-hydroxy-2-oxoheptanedioate aldolase